MEEDPREVLGGRYEVHGIHPGGMGVVYSVKDTETGEWFAAKTVKEEYRDDPRVRSRFEREVRTWVQLGRHVNLVEARFVREIDGAPYLFLEYVSGPTLAALLSADGPLWIPQAVDYALQFALGLSYAHEKAIGPRATGLVHRDVKPSNLFVTREGVAKVSDLGIAKVLAEDLEATAEGIGLGTPYYVSPEQLKGSPNIDGRADIYSFGAVLYEMVTGLIPLHADSLESQIFKVLQTPPEPASALNPLVPASLDELMSSCLQKEPDRRPVSFEAVADVLRPLLSDDALAADSPASLCAICGYASCRTPGACPLCESPMGPPGPFRPRAIEVEEVARAPAPARLTLASVDVGPRPVRVGEELSVCVSLVNHGSAPARNVEMQCVVPDRDTFRSSVEVWRGEVPPSRLGQPFEIEYSLVPLREGSFLLPEIEVRYEAEDGERSSARSTGSVPVLVTFNYHLPFTGREAALQRLKDLFASPLATFVLVEGEPGGGKSRFLEEAAAHLVDDGWQVFTGHSLARAGEPLKVFHDVARQIFGVGVEPLSASSQMARVVDRLAGLIGEDAGMTSFFASFLRGGALAEAHGTMQGYLWFRLLSALARNAPVALVLNDLHWSAGDTIRLAETLVRRAREDGVPIMVIASSLTSDPEERIRLRIAELRDRVAALGQIASRISLPPLTSEDTRRFLDHVFPGNTFAEDHPWLLPALTEQSGGNPFHLLQILRLLREARDDAGEPLVSAEEGAWTIRPELGESQLRDWIPEAVEGMVRALVAPLTPGARNVLESAAVVGEEFNAEILSALVDSPEDLEENLEVLEQSELIRAADEMGSRLRFTSSLVPAILERLVRERSRRAHARLHRKLAEALEATHGRRGLRRVALRFARSLLLAGQSERALRWFVVAAEQLVRAQAYLRADSVLSRASRLIEDGVAASTKVLGAYYYLRGEVWRVTGRLTDALSAFDQATEHLGGDRGRTTLARALSKMGKVHEVRGEIDQALYCYQLGAQIREDVGDTAEMAHSLNNLGSLHLLQGDDDRALAAFTKARVLAEEGGSRSALANSLDNLASFHARHGEWEKAEALYGESFDLDGITGDQLGQAQSLNGLGTIAFNRGRISDAREYYERVLKIRREVGDREGVANVLSNLGVIHDRQGEYEAALSYYHRSVEAHRSIGSRRGLATVLNNIGVVNLTCGDVNRAIDRLEESLRLRREMGDRERLGLSLQNLGEARSLAGRSKEAESCFDEAEDVFRMVGDSASEAGIRAARGAHFRRQGDLERAGDELGVALRHDGRDPRARSELHLEIAEIQLARGEIEGARRAAERGLALAEEGGDRLGRARGLRLVSRVRAEDGDVSGALSLLEEAEALLRGTSGPELARVYLDQGVVLGDREPGRSRELLMRARGVLDALEARGAVLPVREFVDRLLRESPER